MKECKDWEELKPKSKDKWSFVNKKRETKKHQTEWCVTANRYRCMRCGRSGKNMKMHGKDAGPKWLTEDSKHNLGKSHFGRTRHGEKSG